MSATSAGAITHRRTSAAGSAPPILELAGVAKWFRIPSVARETLRAHATALFRPRRFEELRVLDGVDLVVRRGETVGIMGRNGSGKSTLLKVLCGIYAPTRGTVVVRASVTPVLELGIGWNPELDAIDNVHLLGSVMGLTLGEVKRALGEILAFAEVERFARLELKHYSTGMASRLAYATALHTVREVLVLDEVFAVGDAGFRARCEERYRALVSRGHTVLLVSHTPGTVASFCERAVLLEGGRIILDGPAARTAEAYVELLARGAPVAGPFAPVAGQSGLTQGSPAGAGSTGVPAPPAPPVRHPQPPRRQKRARGHRKR